MTESTAVAIAGLGRTRQGLGPFIARALLDAGHEIALVAGRTRGRARAAAEAFENNLRRETRRDLGAAVTGISDLAEALVEARVSVLVIAAPVDAHEAALEAAARAGVSVLCEKPILRPDRAAGDRVDALTQRFTDSGLGIEELCQWPYTLPAFRALHPEAPECPTEFSMLLAPASSGSERIVDSLSHPLSLLTTLAGPGRLEPEIENIELQESDSDRGPELRVCFDASTTSGRSIRAAVRLLQVDAPPRPAGYGWDGFDAEREIDLPDYRQRFVDPAVQGLAVRGLGVAVADPLRALIADVIPRLARPRFGPGPRARSRDVATRIRILSTLVDAHP